MTSTPLVSIVCGYYNRENYVDESVSSLINQTYPNLEILIFDDCSTDNTYEKLKAFENKDNRIRIIKHEKNKGFVKGIIDTINTAKGEYIAIHGSGDYSYPQRIERQVNVLQTMPNVGVVGCFVKNDKLVGSEIQVSILDKKINGNCTELLQKTNPFTHGEVMYRKRLYYEAGGYRAFFQFSQDYDLWTRMSLKCDFFNVQEILYRRFLLSDGASSLPSKRLKQEMYAEIVRYNLRFFLTKGKSDFVDQFNDLDKAFKNIHTYSNTFIDKMYSLFIYVFKDTSIDSTFLTPILKNFSSISGKSVFSALIHGTYLLPRSVSKKLVHNKLFRKVLNIAYRRLP
ncbi:Glycosyltransferase involved in cell wall bisynthesis [Parapedobacter luteus]|uniref:Glycosyltransferase involved in cell wall bisynthesis n=1 Tax=Parapedobacter luteus TaxID=623280 RepID=A0A1T5FQ78_9SPHI|nr:glycosyltransferase family 2 protein [Parapedobacter luteus]SKB98316.1 Glycosyltransferase involved in cell wall bisynthesis [Parapedobacter luteus]